MTNVVFPRDEIEKCVKLTKEVIEKISLFGTPLERIGDKEIEIEVFPNRPDLISMQGFLRGFKAFLGKETGLRKYSLKKPEKNYEVKIHSSVNPVRPFTTCAIVKKLKFNDEKIKEIVDLQEKLHKTIGRNRKKVAIGIYPLEKIELPITYEARNPEKIKFIPLESDKEMNGLQILRKHPKGKEYESLLAYHDKFPVFVDAKGNILSMPPIINSHDTGKITEETKDVFIECSGSHLETLKKTLNIIVTTLADMGGEVCPMILNYPNERIISPDLTPQKMKVSLENVNKLLGLELKEKELEKLLARMGHEYKNKNVFIPAWRTDILHEVDLIEDVAIAYGYDKFVPEIPNVSTIGEESKESKIKSTITEILVGLGMLETSSYHLITKREAEIMKLQNKIEVLDSKTDYKILRPNLLIPTIRILSENKDHEYPQEIFELGRVFSADDSQETGIKEHDNLVVVCSPANFTKIKQVLSYLANSLGFEYGLEQSEHKNLIEGRTAAVKINKKLVGYFGEVHPETLREWGIKMPVAVLEISLEEIFNLK